MLVTSGRIDLSKFKEGWALQPHGMRAHYFTRKSDGIVSDCGLRFEPKLRDHTGFVLFEPGNFPRCKRCDK